MKRLWLENALSEMSIIMPIKDLEKRREYQRELMRKRRTNGLTENVSPSVRPDNFVSPSSVIPKNNVNPVSPMLDPNANVSPKMLDQVRPVKSVSPCFNCSKLEKQVKELELKIISLQETNQILRKDIDYWQKSINPTIELWKNRYFDLEKKSNERWKELDQTILRLKEKLRDLTSKNQAWEQRYSKLENQAKNNNNSLSITDLNNLIEKHKRFQNTQRIWSEKDIKEREFLNSLLNKLWSFA